MTKDEALKLCLEYIETNAQGSKFAILIKEALAQPVVDKSAAVRIATALGWTPQRTWVGLTDEEQQAAYDAWQQKDDGWGSFYDLIEAKLKKKNT